MRCELGDEAYQRENQWFRDAGQRLSGLRDAAVLIETLDRLVEGLGKRAPRSRFVRVRQWLVERRDAAYRQTAAGDEGLADLQLALQRLEQWPLRHRGWGAIGEGLQ